MIAGLKPYAAYKDSGVPRLGEVPEHWEVRRLKTLCSMESGNGITAMSIEPTGEYPVYGGNGLRGYTSNYTHDGNFVLIGRQGALCGNVHLTRGRFWASEHAVVATTHSGHSPEWLGAILGVMNLNQYSIAAAQPGLSVERVLNLRLPVPPLPEQTAIVRFLDHADRRIQRYLRAKQKLMALLEEQKQALIHQAVTGQIDVRTGQPYPATKPSGVEWLGDVPAHWQVVALRRRWRVIDCKHLTVPFVDGGIPLASVREAQSFELNFKTSNRTTPEWYEKLIEGEREPRPGDLIYCRNVSVGAATLVTTEDRFAMGQDVCLIRSSSENQRWLNYFLHSKVMSDQLALILVGSTFNRINVADIKALLITVPPVSEQDRIAAFLDNAQNKLAVAIGNCRREQALLREYRTRLVADVATGQIDVREAAAALPEVDPLAVEDTLDGTIDTDAM